MSDSCKTVELRDEIAGHLEDTLAFCYALYLFENSEDCRPIFSGRARRRASDIMLNLLVGSLTDLESCIGFLNTELQQQGPLATLD